MLGLTVKILNRFRTVEKAVDQAKYRNFGHAGASIRKDAVASIEQTSDKDKDPAPAGRPPRTRRRKFLKRAIRFFADKEGATIGTLHSVIKDAAAAHEHGGSFRGRNYPPRPFMFPALERGAPRFAGDWEGSIKDPT